MQVFIPKAIVTVTIRYILGITMIVYGLIKILRIQFVLPPDIYRHPLGQLDGVAITWAFLGFTPWFSILLGILELTTGLLLLFRKTKLLGAILLFPLLVSVFLINVAYDFMPHMKVLTGALLILNMQLLYPHRRILLGFLKSLINQDSFSLKELVLNTLILVFATLLIVLYWK